MKKTKYLLAIALLGGSTTSFAQFMNNDGSSSASSDVEAWSGLRVSYDRTIANPDWEDAENWKYNGFSVGYEQAFKLAKSLPIFIQTGLDLNFARYKEDSEYEDEDDYKETILGLTIPVNFVYAFKFNNKLALKPYTGFYLRANVWGKGKEGDYDANLFDEDDMGEDAAYKRVQGGWQIGTTLDIGKFNVGFGYALDFNEISEKVKTSKFSVKVGCNF